MTDKEILIIELTIATTLRRLGINPKTYRQWVSKNYAVTVLGISKTKLNTAIRERKINAEYDQKSKRWRVMRKDVESFINENP